MPEPIFPMTEIISGPASASAKVTDQPTIPPSPPGRSIGPAGAPSTPRPGFWSWRRRPFRFLLLGILLLCLILGGSNWYHYLWAVHYYRAADKAIPNPTRSWKPWAGVAWLLSGCPAPCSTLMNYWSAGRTM